MTTTNLMTKRAVSSGVHNDLPGAPTLVTYADGSTATLGAHRASLAVDRAIDRSISHDESVTLDWDEDLETELLARCDDSADNDRVLEFWGRDWRVHLAKGVADADA